jgi:uncharacterized protein (DUF2062 family)
LFIWLSFWIFRFFCHSKTYNFVKIKTQNKLIKTYQTTNHQMTQKVLSELTNQELLEKSKKTKLSHITNAFFIGFLIGIVVFSVVKNSYGMLTLIPLYFIYKLVKESKRDKALEELLKERNLK